MLGETAAFLDAMFGDCGKDDGQIVLVQANRRQPIGVFPVGTSDRLMEVAKVSQVFPGCYYKTQLMDGEAMAKRSKESGYSVVGKRSEVKSIVSLALDVDAGKSEKYVSRHMALMCLADMPLPPTLIVNSGGADGGFHVTWKLSQPHRITDDRERVQAIARRWCDLLAEKFRGKLDNTSNIDRVLRVVSVPRLDGKSVYAEEYHPERVYSLKDFEV